MENIYEADKKQIVGRFNSLVDLGKHCFDISDLKHPWLLIECKCPEQFPEWLQKAIDQAGAASATDKLTIVVLHARNSKDNTDLAVMRLSDFKHWFGSIEIKQYVEESLELKTGELDHQP